MRADWGTQDEAIGKLMDKLQGSRQIPLLAVFPADRPNNPVVLKTFYTKSQLASKLKAARVSHVAANPKDKTHKKNKEATADDMILSEMP